MFRDTSMGLSLAGFDVLMPPVPTTGTDGEDRPPPLSFCPVLPLGAVGHWAVRKGRPKADK